MADEAQTADSWVADGTSTKEPETTETPAAEETVAEVVETATETTEAVETTTEAVTTETVETVEEVVQKFIDAKQGDEAYQLPEDVMLPQTRDGETTYVSIQDVIKRGMMGDDYRIKTTELADGRRTLERSTDDITAREARLDIRLEQAKAREAEMNAALTDPKSAEAYQEHLVQYRDNPMYRKHVDQSLAAQETEAERDVLQGREDARIVSEASTQVFGWIDKLKSEYEGVNPERVRTEYARALSAGTAPLDISAVRSIFQAEAEHVNQILTPLQTELAGIKATLESLQAGAAATEHNETTAHAVGRSKVVPVATGSGAPAKTTVTPGKFTPNELQDRKQAWVDAAQ